MGFTNIRHKLNKFGRLDTVDKFLFLRAAAWLGIARLMIAVVPFQKLSVCLSAEDGAASGPGNPVLFDRIGHAVSAAANNVPWRSDCFPQAIAGRMLLKRYGYKSTIHFGVEQPDGKEINAHAWLSCGDTVVMGGGEIHRYTELHRIQS